MPFATCPTSTIIPLGPPTTGLGVALTNGSLPSNDAAWGTKAQQASPFTLNGAPVSIPPKSRNRQSVTYITQLNGETPRKPITRDIYINTQGLIVDPTLNSGTTLRVTGESIVFSLNFIALHQGIWNSGTPQVSLFFSGRDNNSSLIYFHLCIPIAYNTNSDTNVNLFLNSWLNEEPVTSGMTVNTLLNTATDNSKIQTLNYCLGRVSYFLALSSEPLYLNSSKLPSWLANDTTCSGERWSGDTYTLKTFSDMYTFAMDVRSAAYPSLLNWGSPDSSNTPKYLTSIFTTTTQTTVTPSYYTFKITRADFKQTERKIPKNQMKCYPLDVLKDIDTDGSVTINTKDKKPVSTAAAQAAANGGITAVAVGKDELQAQTNTLILIFVIFFFILGLVLMLAFFRTLFSRESASVLPIIAATLPAILPVPPSIAAAVAAVTKTPASLPPPMLSPVAAGLPSVLPAPPHGGPPAVLPTPPASS